MIFTHIKMFPFLYKSLRQFYNYQFLYQENFKNEVILHIISPCTLSNVFDHYLMYFDGLQAPKVSKVMLKKLNRYRLRRSCVEIFQQSTDNIYIMQILYVLNTGSSQTVSMKSHNIDNLRLCLGFCNTRKQRRRRRILYTRNQRRRRRILCIYSQLKPNIDRNFRVTIYMLYTWLQLKITRNPPRTTLKMKCYVILNK